MAFILASQSTVDKLIKKTNLALVVGTNSWRDQFMEAITVSAGTVDIAWFLLWLIGLHANTLEYQCAPLNKLSGVCHLSFLRLGI